MRIKWENVILLVLLIILIVLLFKMSPLFECLSYIFRTLYYYDRDPVFGILALGLLCMTIVAIVTIISRR